MNERLKSILKRAEHMETVKEQENKIIEVENLKVHFKSENRDIFKAVNDISFHVNEGETYGLVGESGSGKSTTVRAVLKLVDVTDGDVLYKGNNISKLKEKDFWHLRKDLQMIFQDPISSLDPKKRIGETLEEVLKIHQLYPPKERIYRCIEMLENVGLSAEYYYQYPHQISGGQAQRVCIARALIINPSILVCDEPVSALDVSVQAQIINLLLELKEKFNLTQIFIAHDLAVVRHISDRIGTMYLGNIVEEAPTDQLFANPLHPYTKLLVTSIPKPDPFVKRKRIEIQGESTDAIKTEEGCKYQTKCPKVMGICKSVKPLLNEVEKDHFVACHLYGNIKLIEN
jgi:oligopeptide transport system ATP-binding protein